tara:strand:+ start:670 stop:1467 length:798 start_codon:yes stop_codon:yes gene_type:complete
MESSEKDLSPVENFYLQLKKQQDEERRIAEEAAKGKRRGRPRKNKMYFTPITEAAIIAYNAEKDGTLRNKVFNEHIHRALDKLSENIIHTFKFYYFDYGARELKQEVVAFMLEKLPKFQEGKGKAFSYFSIVAKNYLIQNNNKNYKAMKEKAPVIAIDSQRDVTNEEVRKDFNEQTAAFMEAFIDYYDKQIPKVFKSERDRKIAYAVIQLFRERENIENFNKKALYIMIREMTNTRTQYITKVVNTIKKEYSETFTKYREAKIKY